MANQYSIEQFCDMDDLDQLLERWSKAARMSAVVKNTSGSPITKVHGMSEYCTSISSTEQGCSKYTEFLAPRGGIVQCHGGLCDFAEPISLPDGTQVATIVCGQVRLPGFEAPDFHALATAFDLDEEKLAEVYAQLPEKDVDEVTAARELLAGSVKNFVTRSYTTWRRGNRRVQFRR